MKRLWIILMILSLGIISVSCNGRQGQKNKPEESFTRIDMEEAKDLMIDGDVVIVDVRTQEEYDSGHIPDAICIPNETIIDKQPAELPDLSQVILVYCRSGRRSKEAAQKLYDMGYTNIYEFGGIIDWDGEIVSQDTNDEEVMEDEEATEEDNTEITTEKEKKTGGTEKKSTSATTEFDPEDHDIDAYYEDYQDEFDDIDDAYDAFEDDEDAWDDY